MSLTHLAIVLVIVGLVCWLIWAAIGSARRARANAGHELVGFGGWLALLALGVTLGPVGTIAVLRSMFNLPRDGPTIFVIGLLLVILVLQILTAVAMWRRRSYFPKLFAAQSGALLIFDLLALFGSVTSGDTGGLPSVFASMAGAILWTIYVFRSRRVKNTFRRGGANDPAKVVEAF